MSPIILVFPHCTYINLYINCHIYITLMALCLDDFSVRVRTLWGQLTGSKVKTYHSQVHCTLTMQRLKEIAVPMQIPWKAQVRKYGSSQKDFRKPCFSHYHLSFSSPCSFLAPSNYPSTFPFIMNNLEHNSFLCKYVECFLCFSHVTLVITSWSVVG